MRRVNPHKLQPDKLNLSPLPARSIDTCRTFTKEQKQHSDVKSNLLILKSTQMLNTDLALNVNSVAFLPHLSLQGLTGQHRPGKSNLRGETEG